MVVVADAGASVVVASTVDDLASVVVVVSDDLCAN